MSYIKYNYGHYRKEIKDLMRQLYKLKDRLSYHHLKMEYHQEKSHAIKAEIPNVEKQIDTLLALTEKHK